MLQTEKINAMRIIGTGFLLLKKTNLEDLTRANLLVLDWNWGHWPKFVFFSINPKISRSLSVHSMCNYVPVCISSPAKRSYNTDPSLAVRSWLLDTTFHSKEPGLFVEMAGSRTRTKI